MFKTLKTSQMKTAIFAASIASLALSGQAFAQDATGKADRPGIEFELGAAVSTQPSYEGSDRYTISGVPMVRFGYLQLPNGFQLGGGDGMGFGFAPSFRFLSERKAADDIKLTGLNDIDSAFELGAGISYTWTNARIFGDLRYGVTGHNGIVGEVGADLIARPTSELTLSVGPRASFADEKYNQTYFGVSPTESVAASVAAYNAGAGFKSVGVEANMRYEFAQNWAAEASVGYNRLIGDAGSSPVTALGSRDQFTGKVGLLRKFSIDF